MIPLTNYDFQWGRSEVVVIYPDLWFPPRFNNAIAPTNRTAHKLWSLILSLSPGISTKKSAASSTTILMSEQFP